jgi:hypothetical protein
LQTSETAVETRALTKAFGWMTADDCKDNEPHLFSAVLNIVEENLSGTPYNTLLSGLYKFGVKRYAQFLA